MEKTNRKNPFVFLVVVVLALAISLGSMAYFYSRSPKTDLPRATTEVYFRNVFTNFFNNEQMFYGSSEGNDGRTLSLATKVYYSSQLTENTGAYLLKNNRQYGNIQDLEKDVLKGLSDYHVAYLVNNRSEDWSRYKDQDPKNIMAENEDVLFLKYSYKGQNWQLDQTQVKEDKNVRQIQYIINDLILNTISNSEYTNTFNGKGVSADLNIPDENVELAVNTRITSAQATLAMNQKQLDAFLAETLFQRQSIDLVNGMIPVFSLSFFALLAYSLWAFNKAKDKTGFARFLDVFPWEITLGLFFLWIGIFIVISQDASSFLNPLQDWASSNRYFLVFAGLFFAAFCLLLAASYLGLRIIQIKDKGLVYGLWQKTLVYKTIQVLKKIFGSGVSYLEASVSQEGQSSSKKPLLYVGMGLVLTFLYFLIGEVGHGGIGGLLLFIVVTLMVLAFGLLIKDFSAEMKRLIQGSNEIVKGNYAYQIPVEKTYFKGIANNFNRIASNLDGAVKEAVESAKVQSNLVTNVSHDLKTPLTSIINYADLLKDEEDPEKIKDYAQVIHEKSLRLKTLIDDLFEVSQTGKEIKEADLQVLNLKDLLNQVLGEWEDQFTSHDLKLITHLEEDLPVKIDGKRAYRIFDNLCSNISKYGLEGSRIYVDASKEGDGCQVVFKNISREALDKNVDFANRFTRGDEARSSEGHGLGLAIAKSLTLQMKGDFALEVDGDLFKVKVKFPRISGKDEGKMTETA